MRYVRFLESGAGISHGILGDDHIQVLEGDLFGEHRILERRVPLSSVRLLAPCLPGKIVGAAANYHSFIRSTNRPHPKHPLIFVKPASSVIGPDEAIVCPNGEDNVMFEGELGVVIGKRCRTATAQNALEYVFGCTCVNDITDHTMLAADGIWGRGKGSDTFCPLGPVIDTQTNPLDVVIETRIDGVLKQSESSSGMVFDVPTLIAFISRDMTLEPGDVIATGSPAGVERLLPGQTVTVSIDGIGELRNPVTVRA